MISKLSLLFKKKLKNLMKEYSNENMALTYTKLDEVNINLNKLLLNQDILFNIFINNIGIQGFTEPVIEPLTDFPTLQQQKDILKKELPAAYKYWDQAGEAAKIEYCNDPDSSCSSQNNKSAVLFKFFCHQFIKGKVLDVGCGSLDVPVYLKNYPINLIAGIDPFLPLKSHPFIFHQGFSEFIPWTDNYFDSIIVATSLDHVLSLDMALAEIKRVLKPDGNLIVWVAFVAGAQPYDPHAPNVGLLDRFHLFHFDQEWYEALMAKYFKQKDMLKIDAESHFYVYSK